MIRLSVILVTLISVLTACSGAKQPAPTATPSPAAQAPATTPSSSSPGTTTPPANSAATAPTSTATPAASTVPAGGKRYVLVPAESKASYIATELLAGATVRNQAIGSTSAITGELTLDAQGKVQPSAFTVDLRTLTSDRSNRDNYIRNRGLESNRYPNAVFTITEVKGSPTFKAGSKESFELVGKLTIRETERTVTWPITSTVENGNIRWTGTLNTKMTDWGIEPPVLLVRSVAEIDDPMKLEITLVFKPASS